MFGRWKRKKKEENTAPPSDRQDPPAERASEGMTADVLNGIASSAAVSIDQAIFAQSQAQAALFATMVREQRRMTKESQLDVLKYTADIFGISPEVLTRPGVAAKKDHSHG